MGAEGFRPGFRYGRTPGALDEVPVDASEVAVTGDPAPHLERRALRRPGVGQQPARVQGRAPEEAGGQGRQGPAGQGIGHGEAGGAPVENRHRLGPLVQGGHGVGHGPGQQFGRHRAKADDLAPAAAQGVQQGRPSGGIALANHPLEPRIVMVPEAVGHPRRRSGGGAEQHQRHQRPVRTGTVRPGGQGHRRRRNGLRQDRGGVDDPVEAPGDDPRYRRAAVGRGDDDDRIVILFGQKYLEGRAIDGVDEAVGLPDEAHHMHSRLTEQDGVDVQRPLVGAVNVKRHLRAIGHGPDPPEKAFHRQLRGWNQGFDQRFQGQAGGGLQGRFGGGFGAGPGRGRAIGEPVVSVEDDPPQETALNPADQRRGVDQPDRTLCPQLAADQAPMLAGDQNDGPGRGGGKELGAADDPVSANDPRTQVVDDAGQDDGGVAGQSVAQDVAAGAGPEDENRTVLRQRPEGKKMSHGRRPVKSGLTDRWLPKQAGRPDHRSTVRPFPGSPDGGSMPKLACCLARNRSVQGQVAARSRPTAAASWSRPQHARPA